MGWAVASTSDPSLPSHLPDHHIASINPILAAVRTIAEELVLSLYNQRFMVGDPYFPDRDSRPTGQQTPPAAGHEHFIVGASFRPATAAEIEEAEAAAEGHQDTGLFP